MSGNEKAVAFIEFVVKQIVSKPDAVRVDQGTDDMGVLLTVHLDPADNGVAIGREGATVKAMRTLLHVIGGQEKARISLKLDTPPKEQGYNPAII